MEEPPAQTTKVAEEPVDPPKMVPQQEPTLPEVLPPVEVRPLPEPLTEQQIYFNKVNVLPSVPLKEAMAQMYDFGLESFDLNKRVLLRHNLNVDAAVNAIFEDDELYN